jgi:hypothetical protein
MAILERRNQMATKKPKKPKKTTKGLKKVKKLKKILPLVTPGSAYIV